MGLELTISGSTHRASQAPPNSSEAVSYFDKFGVLVLEKQDLLLHLLGLRLCRHLLQLEFLASPFLLVQLLLQVLGKQSTQSAPPALHRTPPRAPP